MCGDKRPPPSQTGRRCMAALAALWLAVGLLGAALEDSGTQDPQPADKPPAMEITWEAPLDQPKILEAMETQLERGLYREDIPLDYELQAALREACAEHGVPVSLALGLIETESCFQPDVVSREGAYGLCQLNPKYFPAGLTPEENIAAGVAYLGELLDQYGDTPAALTVYNTGHDTGSRTYAFAVLEAAERWEDCL